MIQAVYVKVLRTLSESLLVQTILGAWKRRQAMHKIYSFLKESDNKSDSTYNLIIIWFPRGGGWKSSGGDTDRLSG